MGLRFPPSLTCNVITRQRRQARDVPYLSLVPTSDFVLQYDFGTKKKKLITAAFEKRWEKF